MAHKIESGWAIQFQEESNGAQTSAEDVSVYVLSGSLLHGVADSLLLLLLLELSLFREKLRLGQ